VLSEVLSQPETAGIRTNDVRAFQKLEHRAEELLRSGQYHRQTRENLIMEATGTLIPYLGPRGELRNFVNPEQQQMMRLGLEIMEYLDFNFRTQIMAQCHRLVAQLLKYQPGVFRGMPKLSAKMVAVGDDDISIAETTPGAFELHALIWWASLDVEVKRSKWLVNSFAGGLSAGVDGLYCTGNREQLADCCLLSLRETRGNPGEAASRKVFRAVSGTAVTESYSNLLAQRLARGGFQNETQWITNCILSGTPALTRLTLYQIEDHSDVTIRHVAARLMADPRQPADIRVAAMSLLAKSR